MTILYHYTCDHGAAGIEDDGYVRSLSDLRETKEPFLPLWGIFAWFTDLEFPYREALGLTSRIVHSCDRTTHRFQVTDQTEVSRWLEVRPYFPALWMLEETPGAMPAHWWLAAEPVPVVRS